MTFEWLSVGICLGTMLQAVQDASFAASLLLPWAGVMSRSFPELAMSISFSSPPVTRSCSLRELFAIAATIGIFWF